MSAYSWSSIAGSALAGCSAVVIFSASCSDIMSTATTSTHDVRSEIKNAKSRRGNDASNTALLTEADSLRGRRIGGTHGRFVGGERSEEHTSELQSLMRISYAVFCLKKKNKDTTMRSLYNVTIYVHIELK